MPQVRPVQQFFGITRALNYHPLIRKFAAKQPGTFRGKEEFTSLAKVACDPNFFIHSHRREKLLRAFGVIYARQPDDVLDFMRLVRNILSKWEATQMGKVIRFCYEHQTTFVEERRRQYDGNGKLVSVIVKHKLWGKEKTISVSNLPPDEAEKLSYAKLVAIGSLQDKELAKLLDVKTESVKKARQYIARTDKEMAYWEHPEVVRYQKTGQVTAELQSLWEARRKGKN